MENNKDSLESHNRKLIKQIREEELWYEGNEILERPKTTEMANEEKKHKYGFKIYNGRVKIYVDGYVMFSFNQLDFAGYYGFKDCTDLYGITIYLNREKAGAMEMDIYFKGKENWLNILKLLDENL